MISTKGEPTWGNRSNQPIQTADTMPTILAALGMNKDTLDQSLPTGYIETPTANLPFVEY